MHVGSLPSATHFWILPPGIVSEGPPECPPAPREGASAGRGATESQGFTLTLTHWE